MRHLHSPQEAAQWLKTQVRGVLHTDSRRVTPGDGFIAWPGAATDGRRHVPAALAQGATACLVEHTHVNAFDDLFDGGDGKDVLKGFAGDDVLQGGTGVDTLFGGKGGDTFVFSAINDSGPLSTNRDVIRDFNSLDGDVIDLGLIDANSTTRGNQAFTYISSSDFSGVAGELRSETVANGIIVYGDVNGDKVADFSIQLSNAFYVTASDFLL